jgi:hypothetical protein
MPEKIFLSFVCMCWIMGTASNLFAQAGNTDLYGTGRSGNTNAEPPSTSGDKSSDLYGTGRGKGTSSAPQETPQDKTTDLYGAGRGNNSTTVAPSTPSDKQTDMYSGTNKTGQELPPTDKTNKSDEESDLYNREIRAKDVVLVINRPPNIQGLTGLMVMNSAFTRPAGTFAFTGSAMFEDSSKPDYRVIQAPITLTYGITDTIEAGIKTKFVSYDSTSRANESGIGDAEVAVKWRWKTHSTTTPELAIGLAGIIPTGSDSKGLNEVKNWGAKFMVMATSETKIATNSFLGLYLEAQAVYIDGFSGTRSTNTQDQYGVINAGVLLPISTNNRLQAMLELNENLYKRRARTVLAENNQLGVTPALRYVTDTMSFTAGAQILNKDAKGYGNTIRWIGTVSYQF